MYVNASKIIIACLLVASVSACRVNNSGTMERAGERGDEIVDNIKDGKNPLHKKGTLEKLGDDVDETLDRKKNRY